jgi:hypothetical protein
LVSGREVEKEGRADSDGLLPSLPLLYAWLGSPWMEGALTPQWVGESWGHAGAPGLTQAFAGDMVWLGESAEKPP